MGPTILVFTCESEDIFDGEPRDTDSLDERQPRIVYGLVLGVLVVDVWHGVEGHSDRRDDHKGDRYHRNDLRGAKLLSLKANEMDVAKIGPGVEHKRE